jgi:hypothetical protein
VVHKTKSTFSLKQKYLKYFTNLCFSQNSSSSSSSNLNDILTSHDVEELFERATATRTTTYDEVRSL